MSKSSNFFGQPIYGQLIKSLDREKIVEISRKHGGKKYVKSFDGYTHLLKLYAVINASTHCVKSRPPRPPRFENSIM